MNDADPDATAAPNRLESLALTLIFTLVSGGLLAAIDIATRSSARGGWWTQPWLMPGIALTILACANAITLWREVADLRRTPPDAAERAAARAAVLGWLRPVEYLGWFGAYLWAIQHLGYAMATLAFVLFLIWRAGLWSARWALAGVGLCVFMMLVFRVGLGVWMPAPDLYDMFPQAVRTVLIRWF